MQHVSKMQILQIGAGRINLLLSVFQRPIKSSSVALMAMGAWLPELAICVQSESRVSSESFPNIEITAIAVMSNNASKKASRL